MIIESINIYYILLLIYQIIIFKNQLGWLAQSEIEYIEGDKGKGSNPKRVGFKK